MPSRAPARRIISPSVCAPVDSSRAERSTLGTDTATGARAIPATGAAMRATGSLMTMTVPLFRQSRREVSGQEQSRRSPASRRANQPWRPRRRTASAQTPRMHYGVVPPPHATPPEPRRAPALAPGDCPVRRAVGPGREREHHQPSRLAVRDGLTVGPRGDAPGATGHPAALHDEPLAARDAQIATQKSGLARHDDAAQTQT